MQSEVVVGTRVEAPPEVVYDLISDVTQMGRWSPETRSCRWIGGADRAAVGARFRGTNRRGWRRWSTTCTVTAADAGRRFEFDVSFGPLTVATWAYELIGEHDGTIVREHWRERRPRWLRRVSRPVMGVAHQAEHNRAGMEATLTALRAAAEAAAQAAAGTHAGPAT